MKNTNIVILTSAELRHTYVRKAMALMEGIHVLRSYCESKSSPPVENTDKDNIQNRHIYAREVSERDFFGPFVQLTQDCSNPVFLEEKEINEQNRIEEIIALKPDLLIAYGCSIIKGKLLEEFKGRFLNVHLGLSPYYRGAGTNFWPLVNGEPEYVGATFMHMDAGIDTGEIIHQIRGRVYDGDGPHDIGNRLIADIPFVYAEIISNMDFLAPVLPPSLNRPEYYYRRRDFSQESTETLYQNFQNGMIDQYLSNHASRTNAAPIATNPQIKTGAQI